MAAAPKEPNIPEDSPEAAKAMLRTLADQFGADVAIAAVGAAFPHIAAALEGFLPGDLEEGADDPQAMELDEADAELEEAFGMSPRALMSSVKKKKKAVKKKTVSKGHLKDRLAKFDREYVPPEVDRSALDKLDELIDRANDSKTRRTPKPPKTRESIPSMEAQKKAAKTLGDVPEDESVISALLDAAEEAGESIDDSGNVKSKPSDIDIQPEGKPAAKAPGKVPPMSDDAVVKSVSKLDDANLLDRSERWEKVVDVAQGEFDTAIDIGESDDKLRVLRERLNEAKKKKAIFDAEKVKRRPPKTIFTGGADSSVVRDVIDDEVRKEVGRHQQRLLSEPPLGEHTTLNPSTGKIEPVKVPEAVEESAEKAVKESRKMKGQAKKLGKFGKMMKNIGKLGTLGLGAAAAYTGYRALTDDPEQMQADNDAKKSAQVAQDIKDSREKIELLRKNVRIRKANPAAVEALQRLIEQEKDHIDDLRRAQ